MTATPEPEVLDVEEADPLEDGSDRYRIYFVDIDGKRHWLADTSEGGIGTTLVTLRAEGQTTSDDRVGIRDRVERTWVVNPYARGRRP